MVLKGAVAAARTAGTAGSTPPARDGAAAGRAAAARTPGATACCTGGTAASAATAAASGTCAAAAGASRSASTGSGSTLRSQCGTSGVAVVPLRLRIVYHSKPSRLPSNCTRKVVVMQPLRQLIAREHTQPLRDDP